MQSDPWDTLLPGDIDEMCLEFGWFLDKISESMKWNKKHSGAQPCCALELELGWLMCLHCYDPLETVSQGSFYDTGYNYFPALPKEFSCSSHSKLLV